MLVLNIKKGQSVRIGPDIEITIKRTSNDRVQLAIDAPITVPIIRSNAKVREPRNRGLDPQHDGDKT